MQNHSTDKELQAWIAEQDAIAERERAERVAFQKAHPMPSWDTLKFNLKRELYRRAIDA
jgi:hypothetical protein